MQIDLVFPVLGNELPSDHAYDLYAAISRLVPKVHEPDTPIRIGNISGESAGKGMLRLDAQRSRLRFRLPSDAIPLLLPLAGKSLEIAGNNVRLGVPEVHALSPTTALFARMVTIKGFKEPASFLEAAVRQLRELEIAAEAAIPLVTTGPHAGQPRRRVLRVKDKKIVGFPLLVSQLTAEESIRLQEQGLGGRAKMGCGFFVPVKEVGK